MPKSPDDLVVKHLTIPTWLYRTQIVSFSLFVLTLSSDKRRMITKCGSFTLIVKQTLEETKLDHALENSKKCVLSPEAFTDDIGAFCQRNVLEVPPKVFSSFNFKVQDDL